MSSTSIALPDSASAGPRRWFDSTPLWLLTLVLLFSTAAVYYAHRLLTFSDNDVWWHLRSGLWILQNHAIPRSGLFSQSANLPWSDASWGFDVLTATAYQLFGLAGLPILLATFQMAIALSLFAVARGWRRNFWPAVILAAIAQWSISPVTLRPAVCSIVLLAVELLLLLEVRRTGTARHLFWLAPLFVVWVNLDRQFSYGLLVLVLFCIATVVEQLCRQSGVAWFETHLPAVSLKTLGAATAFTLLATFVSPYGYRLHQLVWNGATSSAADRYFRELHALRFRRPEDYALMLLAMTAFFALGRRRSRDLFVISLMIVSAIISFRFERDSWLVAVVSVAVIGDTFSYGQRAAIRQDSRRVEKLLTAALLFAVLLVLAWRLPAREQLMSKVRESFPTGAADYIRQNHLPQPLFNTFAWGGFLTWYLPEYPVYIDGRFDLYGDALTIPYFKLTQAEIPLESHPGFAQAQTILLEASSPMAQALATLPGFRVLYRDEQAVVLMRQN